MAAGTGRVRRLGRQAAPARGGRDCCWYHRGDCHRVSEAAVRLLQAARDAAVPPDEIAGNAHDGAVTAGMHGWELQALDSLFDPAKAIRVGTRGYVNGQHRAEAMLDAGVRRTVVLLN